MSNEGFIKLSVDDVLNKDFTVEFKGYKVEEVDSFLDDISADYEAFRVKEQEFKNQILILNREIERINNELKETKASHKQTKKSLDNITKAGVGNSEMIERISQLEQKIAKK